MNPRIHNQILVRNIEHSWKISKVSLISLSFSKFIRLIENKYVNTIGTNSSVFIPVILK